jgi:hypothetical protein
MVVLTLSAVGALAVAPYLLPEKWRTRLGSADTRRLSPLQKRLLRVSRSLGIRNPEAAIRAQDLVISLVRGARHNLPGLTMPRETLLRDIRDLKGSDADLDDYLALTDQMIVDNKHYAGSSTFPLDLTQRTRFDKLVPWIAIEVERQVQARRSGQQTEAELYRKLGQMVQAMGGIADWIEQTNPPNMTLRNAFDWLEGRGKGERPFTYNQVRYRTGRWHSAMQATAPMQITRGQAVYQGPDGVVVEKLSTKQCLEQEGSTLGHCVAGYAGRVQRGETIIYSMRLPNGMPLITLEIEPDKDTGLPTHPRSPLAAKTGRATAYVKVRQAKGKKNRHLGGRKATYALECLHARAFLERLLVDSPPYEREYTLDPESGDWIEAGWKQVHRAAPQTVSDLGHDWYQGYDLDLCRKILDRNTGWDRIDHTPLGQAPDPMPTQREYNKAMKAIQQQKKRRAMQGSTSRRPAPLYSVERARKAAHFIGQTLATVATAAERDREVPPAQRQRMAAGVHRALVVLDGYLTGKQTREEVSRALNQTAQRVIVQYQADEPAYLSDDGYSRLMLNLIRLDPSQPWIFPTSESLDETKARWQRLVNP